MFSLDLQPNEQVFKIYRQSEWVLAKPVLIIFVGLYLPWFLLARAGLFLTLARWFLLWTITLLVYGIAKYLLWLANSYVVTDQRLIVIRYASLFKKQVNESPLGRILNISYATTGFFSSLLNFGDVQVRVTGLDQPLLLKKLPKPENLKTFLWSLQTHAASQFKKPKSDAAEI